MLSYTDMYNTYDEDKFIYSYPYSFDLKNQEYLKSPNYPNAIVCYGDSFDLMFNISKNWDEGTNQNIFLWTPISPFLSPQAPEHDDLNSLPTNLIYEDQIPDPPAEDQEDNAAGVDDTDDNDQNIEDEPETIDNYVQIEFYNFRYEKVYSVDTEVQNSLLISIDSDTSEQIFKRGVYYCSLRLIDNQNNKVRTIIPAQKFSILVQ